MAHAIRKVVGYEGGIEGKLTTAAHLLMWVGIIGGVGFIIMAATEPSRQSGLSGLFIGCGVGLFVQAFVSFILFKALAETIRLLRKLNGIPYGGSLDEPKPYSATVCSECGIPANYNYSNICPHCKAVIDMQSGSNAPAASS